ATGGHLLGGDPGVAVTSYSIDTRTLAPGALFVALRAERDGHDYVLDALHQGAAGALISREVEGIGLVLVDDTAAALTALGAAARPTIGVITNIGMAHAEFFGSREEVARGKGELLEALPAAGHAILSADDDMTPGLRARTAAAVLTAGAAAGADVRVSGLRLDDELRPSFRLDTPWGAADVPPLPVRGAHQAGNAAFAVAVAGVVGVGLDAAVAGLAGATGSPWRMEL